MRILIASADPDLARDIRLALRSESLVVDVVSESGRALEQAGAVPYNVIVLDLMLPGGGRGDLLQRLRLVEDAAPVLALTADSRPEARIEALRFGADDCLTQPLLMAELTARVHALARRAPRKSGDCLEVEDLVLHSDRRRAFRAGQALPLTEREFLALEHLVRAQGEVVTGPELLDLLWHEEAAPRDNFIAVLIMRLRKKVDGDFSTKLVRTVRGAGYVIRVGA